VSSASSEARIRFSLRQQITRHAPNHANMRRSLSSRAE
jgi:hypothetical protein